MKSLFKHLSSSFNEFFAEKYGFAKDDNPLKNEIRTLQHDVMVEKVNNSKRAKKEAERLRKEAKRLTDEKIFSLEKEVQSLKLQVEYYKSIAEKNPFNLEEARDSLLNMKEFMFKEDYIKCTLNNVITSIHPLKESDLILFLSGNFRELSFRIVNDSLWVDYFSNERLQKVVFPLNDYVLMGELKRLNSIKHKVLVNSERSP